MNKTSDLSELLASYEALSKKNPSKVGQIVYKKGESSNLGKVQNIIKDRRGDVRLNMYIGLPIQKKMKIFTQRTLFICMKINLWKKEIETREVQLMEQ